MKNRTFDKAIHECGHVVVGVLVGGHLAEGLPLSIKEEPEYQRGGVTHFLGLKGRAFGVESFAGFVAENIKFPDQQVVILGGKDVYDILDACSQVESDKHEAECRDETCCFVDRFIESAQAYDRDDRGNADEEKKIWGDHAHMIYCLCSLPSQKIPIKTPMGPERRADFELLASLADEARELLTKHLRVVLELAEWLDGEKEIPNREVHDFLMQKLRPLP